MAHLQLPPSPASPPPRKAKKGVALAPESKASNPFKPITATSGRSISASEIARNISHFETWAMHQGCEQAAFSDLPEELSADVERVFDVTKRIPMSWVDEASAFSRHMMTLCPQLLDFLRAALASYPQIFSDNCTYDAVESQELFEELMAVRLAWQRLQNMRQSGDKWSEADYAANVYNIFRTPAIHRSSYRYQCPISLPQPHLRPSGAARRVLHPKSAVPDSATFIKASTIRYLSHSLKSPYKTLNSHPEVIKHSRAYPECSFRHQCTPCLQLPETACFEFASSFWEDKKPAHELLEHAYRQNRMATAAAARMLYSLRIEVCVFGLVWADGTVRAHVDWCTGERGYPGVFSAPYPGPKEDQEPVFHEWNLDQPSNILQVYFILRNIDIWTSTYFRERVATGVQTIANAVTREEHAYVPWKRVDDLRSTVLTSVAETKENILPVPSGSRSQRGRKGR